MRNWALGFELLMVLTRLRGSSMIAASVKESMKGEKIYSQSPIRKRLERFGQDYDFFLFVILGKDLSWFVANFNKGG